MKITKGTLIRTIATVILIVNVVLKSLGKQIIDIDEASISSGIEAIVSILIIACGFWKNNSFTKNAIAADVYLEELRKFSESDGDYNGE